LNGIFTQNCKQGNPILAITTKQTLGYFNLNKKVSFGLISLKPFLAMFVIGDTTRYVTGDGEGITCSEDSNGKEVPANIKWTVHFSANCTTNQMDSGMKTDFALCCINSTSSILELNVKTIKGNQFYLSYVKSING
ncbi:unnamed protein product, partial [Meganyctiphanes norvegica]